MCHSEWLYGIEVWDVKEFFIIKMKNFLSVVYIAYALIDKLCKMSNVDIILKKISITWGNLSISNVTIRKKF